VLFALITVTIITAFTIGLIAVILGVSTLKEETFRKLTAVRELKAKQIENYFRSVREEIRIYSKGNDVEAAFRVLNGSDNKPADEIYTSLIHINFKNYATSFGFRDLFLVDAETGAVIFTVNNAVHPGTILTGEDFAGTNLEKAFLQARASGDPDFTCLTDFELSGGAGEVVSAFISSPVVHEGQRTGVLIFQIDIEQINLIMTDGESWEKMGHGKTGETYLVGADNLLRNQSRFLVEDSMDFFKGIVMSGVRSEIVNRIRIENTSIRLLEVGADEKLALAGGIAGTAIFRDYRGVTVLAAFKPLDIQGIKWGIISKIDRDESMKAIRVLFKKFSIYIVLLFIVVISLSFVFARDFSRPVEALAIANEQLNTQSAAMQSAANGIIITDITGIVKWVNPAFTRLTGYSFEDIVGNNLKMLNSGIQSKEFFKNMWTTIMAGDVWHNEIVNRRKDGSSYTEEMTITPVRDNQGKISQFVAIKHDITERKKLEQVFKDANERMEHELNVAKDIQMSMLPLKFPAFPEREDIDVFAKLIPAREVGGDFYDYFFIDEENFCFVVGDVSGKGVPAALFMAVTKALIKAGSAHENSTARILTHVNNEISKDNENSMFITVFMAILNTTTGYLVYTNAGHNPSFILRKDTGSLVKLSDLHGLVIGAFEGIVYKETVLQLNRGDLVFAYTDGVTEAQNLNGDLYTEERLIAILENNMVNDCRELVTKVLDDILVYEDEAEQADDITVLSIHFKEQAAEAVVDFLFTSITNKITNIGSVIEKFEGFADKHSISAEVIQKVNIVFDELLTNTISYAYTDDLDHVIEVKIRVYSEKLIVTIMDDGTPYNPFDRVDPDTTLGLEDREIGGLGVHIVKLLVDDYHYEYKSQLKKNITSFKKDL